MSFYQYLSFSSKPRITLEDYKEKLASGELLKGTQGTDVLKGLLEVIDSEPSKPVTKIHFDRSAVRVKTIEDLFYSTTIMRVDPVTGQDFPVVYRQKILDTNGYHDYRYAIEAYLASAKKLGLVSPYSDLLEGYQSNTQETLFHRCYFYDLVSKVPLEILELYPTILHHWMIMLATFVEVGKEREAELIRESILYLVTSSKVFREAVDEAGNLALYYCCDLEIAARYLTLSPTAIDNVNKCGISILLSSYVTRDVRLLLINFSPTIIYTSVKINSESFDVVNKEYFWYSINDSFILRFIIDMFPRDLLFATNGRNTIFNTSKCFDAILYLIQKEERENKGELIKYIRENPKCYEGLFAPKIKIIGLYRESGSTSLEAKIEYIRFDGYQNSTHYLELKKKFDEINADDFYA